jgi:hypothetical protein
VFYEARNTVNVEYIFREGNRYTDIVQEQFAEKFPEIPVPHCNAVRRLEKFLETGSVLDISDSMLQSLSRSLRK